MFSKLQEIRTKVDAYHKEMQNLGQAALQESFKEFFDKYPEVTHLEWTQYTPYFMDGDPCEFGINEINAFGSGKPGGIDKDGLPKYLTEDDEDYDSDYQEGVTASWGQEPKNEFEKDLKTLQKGLEDLEKQMQDIYGDHVRVTVTPTGTTTEEYSHD